MHPQSWRFTSLTFNCILIAASVFFLACISSAKATLPTVLPHSERSGEHDGSSAFDAGLGGRRIGGRRAARHSRHGFGRPRNGQGARLGLDTVHEASMECMSSSVDAGSVSSAREERTLM